MHTKTGVPIIVHIALSVGQPLQPIHDPRRAPDLAQESSRADTPPSASPQNTSTVRVVGLDVGQ